MNTVKVDTKILLVKLKNNCESHRGLFLKAQDGYRKQVIDELDRMILEAKSGKPIRRSISLPEPQDHTSDYDREITMLEMSVDTQVELSCHEFDMYVMDNWSWKAMATATNAMYTSS